MLGPARDSVANAESASWNARPARSVSMACLSCACWSTSAARGSPMGPQSIRRDFLVFAGDRSHFLVMPVEFKTRWRTQVVKRLPKLELHLACAAALHLATCRRRPPVARRRLPRIRPCTLVHPAPRFGDNGVPRGLRVPSVPVQHIAPVRGLPTLRAEHGLSLLSLIAPKPALRQSAEWLPTPCAPVSSAPCLSPTPSHRAASA